MLIAGQEWHLILKSDSGNPEIIVWNGYFPFASVENALLRIEDQ